MEIFISLFISCKAWLGTGVVQYGWGNLTYCFESQNLFAIINIDMTGYAIDVNKNSVMHIVLGLFRLWASGDW